MKESENLLITSNLAIGYPSKGNKCNALQNNLDLSLKPGEFVCLLGANGCGKSTLIRTLSGFHQPLSGRIMIKQSFLEDMTPAEISKIVSVSLTDPVDVGNMSVFSVVAFGRSPYTGFLGKLNRQDFEIIRKSLQNAGILNLHNRQFSRLSDGERQKVMIAKSLAQETSIMFLDEPTAFLDFTSKIEILHLLRDAAWEHQKAILITTHDINLALKFADKIWLMGKNMPVITGVQEDLILKNEFGKYFDNEKTKFDIASGGFTFETSKKSKIFVHGSGFKFDWLVKALIRKGFQVFSQENQFSDAPFISVDSEKFDCFELKINNEVYKLSSIEALLDLISILTKTHAFQAL